MRYIDVSWKHDSSTDPYRLVSEIDETNYESRKLEFFKDGEVGFASSQIKSRFTGLGDQEIPSLEEINSSSELVGKNISKTEFDALWQKYVQT